MGIRKRSYMVSVLILTDDEKILIIKKNKHSTPLWKLPGGRSLSQDFLRPKRAAIDKIKFKTGITVQENQLRWVYGENRKDHNFFLYVCRLQDVSSFFPLENIKWDGGAKFVENEEIIKIDDFIKFHKILIEKHLAS